MCTEQILYTISRRGRREIDRTSPTEIIGSWAVIIQLLKVLIIWGQSLSILVLHAMSNTNIQIEDTLENCSQVFFIDAVPSRQLYAVIYFVLERFFGVQKSKKS